MQLGIALALLLRHRHGTNNSVVNPWVGGFKRSYTSPIAGSIDIFGNSRVSFAKKFGEIVDPQVVGSRPNLSVWGREAVCGEFDTKIQIKKTKNPISVFFI